MAPEEAPPPCTQPRAPVMAPLPKLAVFDLGEGPCCGEFRRALSFSKPQFQFSSPCPLQAEPSPFFPAQITRSGHSGWTRTWTPHSTGAGEGGLGRTGQRVAPELSAFSLLQ